LLSKQPILLYTAKYFEQLLPGENGMALQSPGVQVTVIDESFYTPAEPGTTPLIVVATAQDKVNGAGTGTASATTQANAGKAFKLTSQRDLVDLFGVPFFEKTASSTPVHGSERNEYGLLAAYSLLGVSNAAFIVRADVDLDQLEAQADAPGANPTNGQWWIDTRATAYGIQEWNGAGPTTVGGQKFTTKLPIILTDNDSSKIESNAPKASVGAIGDYAVVFQTVDGSGTFTADQEYARIYYKSVGNGGIGAGGTGVAAGDWVLVGSPEWKSSHAVVSGTSVSGSVAYNLYVNNSLISGTGTIAGIATAIQSANIAGVTAQAVNGRLFIYSDGESSGSDSTADGTVQLENGTTAWSALGIAAGRYAAPRLQQTPHTSVPAFKISDNNTGDNPLTAGYPTGSVWIKTTEPNQGARWRASRWNSATTSWVAYEAPIYASTTAALNALDRSNGGTGIEADSLFVQSNADEASGFDSTPETASFRVWRRANAGTTTITSKVITTGTVGSTASTSFSIAESILGQATLAAAKTITFTPANTAADADTIAALINAAGFANIEASLVEVTTTTFRLQISHRLGGDFKVADTDDRFINLFDGVYNLNTLTGTANLYPTTAGDSVYDFLASNWQPLAASNFEASNDAPVNEPTDGQLWYNPNFAEVDIMIHNGETWVGYRNTHSPFADANTSRNGYTPIVAASNPYTSDIETGDLWISTADLENYPTIYRYNNNLTELAAESRWELVDKTDQTTEEGVLFTDARYGISGATGDVAGSIADLAVSNFLDFDAPDPALYPKGMLLWNLRRSGGNVKRYANSYVSTTEDNPRFDNTNSPLGQAFASGQSMSGYATDRWTTASPNNEDGSGSFGRKAQRGVVVAAMKSAVDTSSEIRDEERRNFNLIAAPGYPELMSNLVNLNIDRGVTAFVVGDTPLRLPADATSLTTWGTNANLVTDNGDDGVVTYDEYLATFYPNGFTTDLSGSNAVVPASHMMLRTIALSDNVSYPWFAPAGTRRGGITNATAVGFIDALSGEFQTVALNEGQRDTLYDLKINPIPFFNGVGLVNYGQKTRARNASALDRINVARLVVYLRSQLNKLARPYIFEPNDKITRDEIKQAVESLLLELVGLRALYDFAVVCDESNNTPARIDRNELYVDIAIEPVKAVEFIYIPLRVKNTGEI
jgi:hypothetical protein